MFPTAVYSVNPIFKRHTLFYNMGSIRIIRRKEMWLIRMGGQSTNIITRGNRDGSW